MSSYQKYLMYKMKYLSLKQKYELTGGGNNDPIVEQNQIPTVSEQTPTIVSTQPPTIVSTQQPTIVSTQPPIITEQRPTISPSNNKQDMFKQEMLIYNKKIINLPNEYLQNILYIIITNNKLNINDFYINYVPDPVEHNKANSKYTNIHIYAINPITPEHKQILIDKIDEKLKKYLVN